ncbi:alpha/beta hydrolase family protein [Hymenobacter busanensis]|uniref:alpha/beta hydrolase family protein n=1 Tax=Hymenobacter busanensis TaxID=2607656 RepID=UPI001366AF07|nr:alpha/beta fold hydrolase [Hymenobacter busanensis]QHJ08859.1 alpha/beta fold hydrolase [Hymenobacter busanensis]
MRKSSRWWVLYSLLLAAGALLNACAPEQAQTPPPTGHYEGTLTCRGAELRVTFDLRELHGDTLQADLRVPTAQGLGWQYPIVQVVGTQLKAASVHGPRLDVRHESNFFRGTVYFGDTLQANLLVLRRGEAPKPLYQARPLPLPTAVGTAAATLLVPTDTLLHPAVVLLHGSGTPHQQDLYAYADLLARNGFVALVYDRRDARQRGPAAYSQTDLAEDALAAVRVLKAQPRVDSARVGLWGISQGATVAALAAGQPSKPVAFVVGVSGPGVSWGAAARYQNQGFLRQAGVSPAEMRQALRAFDAVEQFVRRGRPSDSVRAATVLAEAWQQPWASHTTLPKQLPTAAERKTLLQWRDLDLDPRQAWQRVPVPALLLYGAADDRFNARETAQRLRSSVGRRRGSAVKLYPNADHEIMLGGAPADSTQRWQWPQPAPGYLEDMLGWLKQQTAQQ